MNAPNSGAGQYYVMDGAGQPHGGNCAAGTCPTSSAQASQSGQRQPGLESGSSVVDDPAGTAASMFAPGGLDQQDAILLWTGVNTLLFATLVYLELRGEQ